MTDQEKIKELEILLSYKNDTANGFMNQVKKLQAEMHWLDQHCSFVADSEYNIGPFKTGELRLMAQAGLETDKQKSN